MTLTRPSIYGLRIAEPTTLNLTFEGQALLRALLDYVEGTSGHSFAKIRVAGQSDVDADQPADALTFASGTSIAITTTPGSDTVMISVDGLAIGSNVQAWDADLDNLAALSTDPRTETLTFVIDGGGSAIATGVKGYLEVPFACTITQATALADQSGSIVVDIWKDTYANYPPVDADSITASAPVTISAADKAQDSTLTGWTTAIAAGDILGFNVDSASTVTRVTIILTVLRS